MTGSRKLTTPPGGTPAPALAEVSREAIERALRATSGNVTRSARTLGMHRNQLRRWLAKHGVDPSAFGSGDDVERAALADEEG